MVRLLDSFKLTLLLGMAVTAGSLLRAESVLNFPRLDNAPSTLTGVALINPNPEAAVVTLTAYRPDGSLVQGEGVVNPAVRMIPANRQLALLTTEIFGSGPSDLDGWFQATSPSAGLTGFYLFLNFPTSFFDGADLPSLGRKIIFNQIRIDATHSTELNLVNPSDLPTGLDLLLFDGEQIIEVDPFNIDFTIPPRGSVRLDAAEFFQLSEVSAGAYVLAVSDTNIGGFQLVGSGDGDIWGINAHRLNEQLNEIFFPQLAVLGPLSMEIGLVNSAPVSATMFITAYQPNGSPYGAGAVARNRVVRNLAPGQALREDVAAMFGFQGDEALEGWIQVESTEAAVTGYVTYGFPADGAVAAVAAPARAVRRAVFSHLATSLGFFTGVAALNPSALAANVRIVAVGDDGSRLGTFDTVLGPGARMSRLITDLIPESLGRSGGLVWVGSDRPLYLTSLFGTLDGSVLANIPPQPIPESYRPDTGVPSLAVAPTLAVADLNQTVDFDATGALDAPAWSLSGRDGADMGLGMIDETGLYTAPGAVPALPVTVTATRGAQVAAATLDLVTPQEFEDGLAGVSALTYSAFNRRLYAVRDLAGGGGELLEVSEGSTQVLRAFPEEDIVALAPFRDFTGRELLVLGSRSTGFVIRYDPVDDMTRDLVGGFEGITAMAFNPVTGNLVVADEAGLTEIPFPLLESDLVSGLDVNGSLPRFLLVNSNIGGLAIDGCDGKLYYTHTVSGEIRRFDPADGTIEVVAAGLQSPGPLLGLQRRSAPCGGAFHVLAAETEAGRLSLAAAGDGLISPWLDAPAAQAMAFLEFDNGFGGDESLLVVEGAAVAEGAAPAGAALSQVRRVLLPRLYQVDAINPLDASPSGIVADPVNDLFQPRQVLLDIVELSALDDGAALQVRVTFADPAAPARGFIELDTDGDRFTGSPAVTDFNTPYDSGLGVDLRIDLCEIDAPTLQCLYDPARGTADIFESRNGELLLVGTVDTAYGDRTVTVTIPSALLPGQGPQRIAAVFGPLEGPADAAPNGGFLLSERVSAPASSALRAARRVSPIRQPAAARARGAAAPEGNSRGWIRVPR